MEWKIGLVPQPVRRLLVPSAQETRNAALEDFHRARIAPPVPEPRMPAPPVADDLKPSPPPVEAPAKPQRRLTRRKPGPLDALRESAARKLAMFVNAPRTCPSRQCKRHRACVSAGFECSMRPVEKPMSPKRDAALRAAFYRAVKRRAAEARSFADEKDAAAEKGPR